MRKSLSLAAFMVTIASAFPALAAGRATVTIELPRVAASTYRKPYVAAWLEDANGKQVRMLSVFHDQTKIGARWLPELRSWWRVGGRALNMPADGISKPTQAPGRHTVNVSDLDRLAAGRYTLVVEAAREKGGREIVKVPFDWRAGKKSSGSAKGSTELGTVAISVVP